MNPGLYYWPQIAICFFALGFFSLTETALTTLSGIQSERLAASKGILKGLLRFWIRQPNRLLTTILVGNTLANTAAAALGTLYFERHYPRISIALVAGVLTLLILVFGEIAPKIFARNYAEQIAPLLLPFLLAFHLIIYPLTFVVTFFISFLLRALGVRMSNRQVIRPTDIEYMVLRASREGSMERDKTTILSSFFQFTKRRVKDIMIPRDKISAISVDATLLEVLDKVRQENHSRYPVFNKDLDRIVGFLHARDLFGILRSYGFSEGSPTAIENFSLRTCLRRAFFISEQSLISRVLNEMKSSRTHLAIVKDEWGNVVGLVTLEDILEEVFGEIEDEHDDASAKPIVDLYSTGVEIEGSESLVDIHSKYGIEIEPTESYSTVNGFLQHYASHQQISPKTVVIWKNYVFSIEDVKDGEIQKVRLTEIPGEKRE